MTNHGLNLLTYYYMDQADLLTDDEDADVTEANTRYDFIQAVRLNSVHLARMQYLCKHPGTRLSDSWLSA